MNVQLYAVELRTSQWDAMVAWYRDRLGLQSLIRIPEEQYALLAAGDARLSIIGRDQAQDASARWSLAFECADLEQALAQVAPPGARILRNPEGYRELIVSDPDANRVRLFAWPD